MPQPSMGFFLSFFFFIYIFSIFALSFANAKRKTELLIKAFSGRFGFDVLELRNFKLSVKNKAAGTPHVMIIHSCIYHSAWGFQRCSVRLTGQCEGLNT